MRPGRCVHDRVCAVDELELVVVPRCALGAFVLAVADHRRPARERLAHVARVEDELDHLPVALVQVVEVVVDVEDPVLERELVRIAGVGDDVRVDGRSMSFREAAGPQLVVAAGVERVPREVEVVSVEAGDVLCRRGDLDEVVAPWSAQGDSRLTEEQVDVHRLVRLAAPALLLLLDEPNDRRVALSKRRLVGERAERGWRPAEREERKGYEQDMASGHG